MACYVGRLDGEVIYSREPKRDLTRTAGRARVATGLLTGVGDRLALRLRGDWAARVLPALYLNRRVHVFGDKTTRGPDGGTIEVRRNGIVFLD